MHVSTRLGAALSLVLLGAAAAEGWEDQLAGSLCDPQLPSLSIASFNVRMGGQISIVPPAAGACTPPRVAAGQLAVLQSILLPREPTNCMWPAGFAEMTVTISAENAFHSAERIATVYTAKEGAPCYTVRNATSSLQFWVDRDRVLTVAAVEGAVTLAVVDQSLLTSGSEGERRFVAGFDDGLLGECPARLRSGAT